MSIFDKFRKSQKSMLVGKDIEKAKLHGRKIVDAIATKNYGEIENLVDDMVNWNALLLEEFIEGTLETNNLPNIDKSDIAPNEEQERIYEYTNGFGFGYEYSFSVGGGEPFPELVLSLEFIYTKGGDWKVVFESGISAG